jgi:DNA-binding XRE family transcriptional regulator
MLSSGNVGNSIAADSVPEQAPPRFNILPRDRPTRGTAWLPHFSRAAAHRKMRTPICGNYRNMRSCMYADTPSIFEVIVAKQAVVKTIVQFIRTPDGSDLAVLPRTDYDRLVALAAEAQEDAAASKLIRNSQRALKEGKEVVLPKAVADRLADGGNPVRVIREWRTMIQGELAVAVGISPNYLSEIETGRRKGPAGLQKKLARALGVPTDLLID